MELVTCQARDCFCVVNKCDILCDECLSRLVDAFGRDAVEDYLAWRSNPQVPFAPRHEQWIEFLKALRETKPQEAA